MVSPAPTVATRSGRSKAEEAVDEAFKALLSSQQDILAQLNFGNSMSEIQISEGTEHLPIVSPHASAEFHSSYTDCDRCNYQQQFCYPFNEGRRFHRAASDHSFGVGDDRFILDQINIEPGEVRGPEMFDIHPDFQMRRRKRETEQELLGYVAQRKKRRNSAMNGSAPYSFYTNPDLSFGNDLLPGVSDLADMDESSSSLLLDDLDFPSTHFDTDPALWTPRERDVSEDSANDDGSSVRPRDSAVTKRSIEEPEKPASRTVGDAANTDIQEQRPSELVSVEERGARPRLPRRSTRSLYKPRSLTSSGHDSTTRISIEDQRSMWKPRKRRSYAVSLKDHDSCDSLQVEDLELDKRTVARTVSSRSSDSSTEESVENKMGNDGVKESPSRTSSSNSTVSRDGAPTVRALSVALQQSIGSTKTIQAWDRKMGLKRSHSKTMRLSCKSREQLLAFLKQEQEDLTAAGKILPVVEQHPIDDAARESADVEL